MLSSVCLFLMTFGVLLEIHIWICQYMWFLRFTYSYGKLGTEQHKNLNWVVICFFSLNFVTKFEYIYFFTIFSFSPFLIYFCFYRTLHYLLLKRGLRAHKMLKPVTFSLFIFYKRSKICFASQWLVLLSVIYYLRLFLLNRVLDFLFWIVSQFCHTGIVTDILCWCSSLLKAIRWPYSCLHPNFLKFIFRQDYDRQDF